jgi:zinc transport system ATP-binding protein
VTSHNAFGYLANRYGLRQVGIAGLSPESEPSPRELGTVTAFVRANRVRTIYYETLVSPDVARTVAAETGARTAVLDPLEGLSDASAGRDYPRRDAGQPRDVAEGAALQLTDRPPVVRLRGAAIGYGDHPVVRGADLTVHRGEVIAVLGPNGAGKSTLVRGILGLARVSEGSVELFGTPARRFRDRWRIGYVPQRHTVAAGVPATVREVVASGRLPRVRRLRPMRPADRAAVDAAIATVGLRGLERVPVSTLSGGQQRRLLIARALAADPEVLVMDEPTAGVDATSQEALAATMRDLVEGGTTILLVTHELGVVASLITRVVEVRDGRITYDGPPLPAPAATAPAGDPVDPHAHGTPPPLPRFGLGDG